MPLAAGVVGDGRRALPRTQVTRLEAGGSAAPAEQGAGQGGQGQQKYER